MKKVENLLTTKGHDVWHISPEDSVYNAIKLMEDKEIGALAVLLNGIMIGIISERDYARKVILKNRSSKETKIKEIMTRQVYYAASIVVSRFSCITPGVMPANQSSSWRET